MGSFNGFSFPSPPFWFFFLKRSEVFHPRSVFLPLFSLNCLFLSTWPPSYTSPVDFFSSEGLGRALDRATLSDTIFLTSRPLPPLRSRRNPGLCPLFASFPSAFSVSPPPRPRPDCPFPPPIGRSLVLFCPTRSTPKRSGTGTNPLTCCSFFPPEVDSNFLCDTWNHLSLAFFGGASAGQVPPPFPCPPFFQPSPNQSHGPDVLWKGPFPTGSARLSPFPPNKLLFGNF